MTGQRSNQLNYVSTAINQRFSLDVLITWNEPDRRSDRNIVKNLEPLLVIESGCSAGEPRETLPLPSLRVGVSVRVQTSPVVFLPAAFCQRL
jgi:hypothetical protein